MKVTDVERRHGHAAALKERNQNEEAYSPPANARCNAFTTRAGDSAVSKTGKVFK